MCVSFILIPIKCLKIHSTFGEGSRTIISTICVHHRVYRLHERLVNLRSEYNLRLKAAPPVTQATMVQVSQQQQQSKVRPELDEVTLRYAQDLLAWVEENQKRLDGAEWGSDLATVESQLGSHRGLHQTVEDFRAKIERARADEVANFTKAEIYLIAQEFIE